MDFVGPVWAPLIGLLVLVAVVVGTVRMRGPGSAPMRRALLTVGGGIVAVFLIGVVAEGCSGPADRSPGDADRSPGDAVVQP